MCLLLSVGLTFELARFTTVHSPSGFFPIGVFAASALETVFAFSWFIFLFVFSVAFFSLNEHNRQSLKKVALIFLLSFFVEFLSLHFVS